jgi:hypothetical protein
MFFQLCERAVRSRVTLRKEGQVELLGETPNGLSASATLANAERSINTFLLRIAGSSSKNAVSFSAAPFLHGHYKTKLTANSRIAGSSSRNAVRFSSACTNETFSVAMRVSNPNRSPFKIES